MTEVGTPAEIRPPSTSDKYARAVYALTYEPPVEPYSEENKRKGLAAMYGYAQTLHALLGPRLKPGRHPSVVPTPADTSAEAFKKIEAEQIGLDKNIEQLDEINPMEGDKLRKKYLNRVMKLIRHEANSENPLTLAGVAALGILATERTDEAVRVSAMNYLTSGKDVLANKTFRVFNKAFPAFKPTGVPPIVPTE